MLRDVWRDRQIYNFMAFINLELAGFLLEAFYFVLETCSESFLSSKFDNYPSSPRVFFYFFSPTERIKEILNDFYAVITKEEEQKSNSAMDEMKTSAAELMEKLETKRG